MLSIVTKGKLFVGTFEECLGWLTVEAILENASKSGPGKCTRNRATDSSTAAARATRTHRLWRGATLHSRELSHTMISNVFPSLLGRLSVDARDLIHNSYHSAPLLNRLNFLSLSGMGQKKWLFGTQRL